MSFLNFLLISLCFMVSRCIGTSGGGGNDDLEGGLNFYFSSNEDIIPAQGTFLGRVSVGSSFEISFDLTITGNHGGVWANILHFGNADGERQPGIWLWPNEFRLHISFGDYTNWNQLYDIADTLEVGTRYHIRLTVSSDGTITSYLNGDERVQNTGMVHTTRFQVPIWASDPWYTPALVVVSNLNVEPFDDGYDNDMKKITNKKYQAYSGISRKDLNVSNNGFLNDLPLFARYIVIIGSLVVALAMVYYLHRFITAKYTNNNNNKNINQYSGLLNNGIQAL